MQTKTTKTRAPKTTKTAQAPAPVATDAKPAELTAAARRREQAAEHLKAGAHAPNVRGTTNVRIPLGIAKYNFSHLASKPHAARVNGLPNGTAEFYRTNAKAYAGKTVNAAQLDNAKLARCITAGLATVTGATKLAAGDTHATQAGSEPVRVTFIAG